MYEGKFGNREWEQQRGTEEDQCYRTNEYCMLEEINWRSDEDIDEEALNILLRKYYQMWLENGITRTFTSEELNQYPVEKEKLNLMLMYNVCVETLGKFFSKTVNIQKYPEYFIKYYELKNLFAMLGTVKPEYEKKYGFSYDNYGEYAKDVEKDVIATIKQIGNPIDYKKVKSGRYVKPVDNKSVQKEGTDTTRPANNINQKNEYQNSASTKKRFWKDWGIGKKILFVILNLCTYCIPVILYLIIRLLKKLVEKNKVVE